MTIRSLNQLRHLRVTILSVRRIWLQLRHGARIHPTSSVSLSGRIVGRGRDSLVIGRDTLIAFKTLLITRDSVSGETRPIRIGARCFVGGGAVVLPGVTIGDESIVGGGAVVTEDVPPRSIVVGNPARVIRRDIEVGKRGRLKGADENSRRLWR